MAIKAIGRFMFNSRNEQTETKLLKSSAFNFDCAKPNLTNIVKSVILLLQVPFSELEQYTAFFDQKNY
jgi:hypothetical protein